MDKRSEQPTSVPTDPGAVPFPVTIAIYMAVVSHLSFLSAFAWLSCTDVVPPTWDIFAVACVTCILGLLRRLEWSRNLAAVTLLALVILVLVNLTPVAGRSNAYYLAVLFGFMPSNLMLWVIIILLALVLLSPLVVMDTHAARFRRAWW